jgi:FtsP/CotA-like multicopper oxidase with cupredoxin domain
VIEDPEFITVDDVLDLHRDQIERYGGDPGIRDRGLIEAAVAMPRQSFGGQFLHAGLFEMAAGRRDVRNDDGPLAWRPDGEVVNRGEPRRFDVSMSMMRWQLNGRSFDMTDVGQDERVKLGSTEDWEFRNLGGMMTMAHPIHIHAGQFQVLEREVAPQWQAAADTLRAGLVTEGWKDTFLLLPGERVRLRMRFERYAGLFLYHCHNLEHEDAGMMRNFRIEA